MVWVALIGWAGMGLRASSAGKLDVPQKKKVRDKKKKRIKE